jgi:hypothetical protein
MKNTLIILFLLFTIGCSSDGEENTTTPPIESTKTTFKLSVTSNQGGKVSSSGGTFEKGKEFSITATPNEGFEFSSWSNSSTENPIKITLSQDTNLTASFNQIKKQQYTLTVSADSTGSVEGGGTYDEGTSVTITASPTQGYELTGWEGSSETTNSITIVLDSDLTLTPIFQLIALPKNYYTSGDIIQIIPAVLFDRSLEVYGIKLIATGAGGGQTVSVPNTWIYKTAQVFKMIMDKDAEGINKTAQERMIKTLLGEEGWHMGRQTGQRIAVGGGGEYSPSFLTEQGKKAYQGLENYTDALALDDMVWYKNIDSKFTGDDDISEVLEHVLHTIHRFGVRGAVEGSTAALDSEMEDGEDISGTEIFLALKQAIDGGVYDVTDMGGFSNKERWPMYLKEYTYLLTFAMWEFSEFWEGGTLAPEWNDNSRTQEGLLSNNPLGYALYNKYFAPVISKPSKTTLRTIFQDNDQGESGYQPDSE